MFINICIFNHLSPVNGDYRGVYDQINYLKYFFDTYGVSYRISNLLDPDALNLMIENFNQESVIQISNFCERYDKKIVVVMTEHLNIGDNNTLRYGIYTTSDTEYIGNIDQRIYSLTMLSEYILSFTTIGELPLLKDIGRIYGVSQKYRLNYPKVRLKNILSNRSAAYDLSFTGYMTRYRHKVEKKLSKKYSVNFSEIVGSDEERRLNLLSAKAVVNVPQNPKWVWVSPMRVINSLKMGLPCVHYGGGDETVFFNQVLSWVTIETAISEPEQVWKKQVEACNDIALDDGKFFSFLRVWSRIERV